MFVFYVCLHVVDEDPYGGVTLHPHLRVSEKHGWSVCRLQTQSWVASVSWEVTRGHSSLVAPTIIQIANLIVQRRNAIKLVLEACLSKGKTFRVI